MPTSLRSSLSLAGLVLAATVLLAGCGGGGGSTSGVGAAPAPEPEPPALTAWALQRATDSSLTAWLREALGPNSTNYVGSVWARDVMFAMEATAATAPSAAGAPAAAFSGTTLQETGVDESDRIKSDGVFVFDVSANAGGAGILRRQRLDGTAADATMLPAGTLTLPFPTGQQASGLYLDTERAQLAVLAEGNAGGIYDNWFAPQWWGQGQTGVALVEAPATGAMKLRRTLRFDATMIGSRRIGATLYLVLRSYPQVPGIDPWWPAEKAATNQAALDRLQATQLLPTLSVDGGPAQALVQPSDCYTQPLNAQRSADMITVVAVDLAASTHRHAARCFAGGTEAFYMSEQSLYLATTRSAYSYSGAFPVYADQTTTDIHKFALSGLDITYRGSGNVTGHLGFDQNRKSFRMGEHDGALRVITQSQERWGGWIRPAVLPVMIDDIALAATADVTATPGTTTGTPTSTTTAVIESPGRLTILTESGGALAVVGELPNAARPEPLGKPGEQLYASRFIGNRGYLVTYRLTDPLYVLDLSNPADPKVAGELQVDGYSDYLFPLSENLLLGVGKDAAVDGSSGDGRFAWYQGVKVSLIDVSNPAAPREAARHIIGRRGTDATVLRDHHGIALQTVGGVVRVGLPVRLHDTPTPWTKGAPNDYYDFTRTELQRLEVNLSTAVLSARKPLPSSLAAQRDIGNDRALLWNDQAHWYQDGTWLSAPW
jgi:hypothetical protein